MAKQLNDKQRKQFDTVCEAIADGMSLRKACEADDTDDILSKKTIMLWLKEDENGPLCDQYTRARQKQADAIFDECLDIADQSESNSDNIQHARLRIDTRKWMAGKLRPKKYGDKVGVDLDAKVKSDVTVHSPSEALKQYVDTIAERSRATGESSD